MYKLLPATEGRNMYKLLPATENNFILNAIYIKLFFTVTHVPAFYKIGYTYLKHCERNSMLISWVSKLLW